MKNKILLAILAIALVLVMTACSNGGGDSTPKNNSDNDSNSSGGGTIGTIVSEAKVEYPSAYITNMTEAKAQTSFYSWPMNWDNDKKTFIQPGCATISGGKVTIKLGTPKNDYLSDFSWEIEHGISVNPSNAKALLDEGDDLMFYTSDEKYALICIKDFYTQAVLGYADRDVTVKGTIINTYGKEILDCSFKKGWNYFIISNSEAQTKYTTSSKQPEGFKWTVVSKDKLEEVLAWW